MAKAKTKAPIQTLAEDGYLRQLAASKTPVAVKLNDGKIVHGKVEIFDADILRLSQHDAASLMLYKEDIQYIWEEPSQS